LKRLIILVLIALLLFGAAGCSFNGMGAEHEVPIYVGLLTDEKSMEKNGKGAQVWDCLQQLMQEIPGFQCDYLTMESSDSVESCVKKLAEQGCNLLLCTDSAATKAIERLAVDYAALRFVVLDDTVTELPNVAGLIFSLEQTVYLAGFAAGKATISDRVGCIHGRMTDETESLLVSFMAGAKAANSDIEILRRNILGKTDGGRLAAEEMVANGVDMIFHVDGLEHSVVHQVCLENGIWSVGTDQPLAEAMLASAQKMADAAVRDYLLQISEIGFKAGNHVYGLQNGGVALQTAEAVLTEKAAASVESMKEKLSAGEMVIPGTLDELEEKYPGLTGVS